MRKVIKNLSQGDWINVAVGLAVGFAAFYLVGAVVQWLTPFSFTPFSGEGSRVAEYAIVFVVVLGLAYPLVALRSRREKKADSVDSKSRICPECASSIPAVARRCKFCTAELGGTA
jgi:hypothetical protein